ncbi:hypothetical protein GCM10010174_69700 [Kutzneria viridogrisea]|uniref:Uncharacterized protein n=1 Tax=Kutzneria viridogrisea TaxID=47990 RepID=A0ABR6BBC8_9PSEU|nr:hypothetical protein [Kutzneria viridogrisea]
MDLARERLALAMNDRRLELGLYWTDVAKRAGMTAQNLLRIRNGEIGLTPLSKRAIDRAMSWEPGRGVDHVLNAMRPVATGVDVPAFAVAPGDGIEELLATWKQVRDTLGEEQADRFIVQALRDRDAVRERDRAAESADDGGRES